MEELDKEQLDFINLVVDVYSGDVICIETDIAIEHEREKFALVYNKENSSTLLIKRVTNEEQLRKEMTLTSQDFSNRVCALGKVNSYFKKFNLEPTSLIKSHDIYKYGEKGEKIILGHHYGIYYDTSKIDHALILKQPATHYSKRHKSFMLIFDDSGKNIALPIDCIFKDIKESKYGRLSKERPLNQKLKEQSLKGKWEEKQC